MLVRPGRLGAVGISAATSLAQGIEPPAELQRLGLSAPLTLGQPATVNFVNAQPDSAIAVDAPGMVYDPTTRTLSGTPTRRSFLVSETSNGVSRDSIIFARDPAPRTMPLGMGVSFMAFYVYQNILLDHFKCAGVQTAPATVNANEMPITLAPNEYGGYQAYYLINLKPGKHRIITDGDLGTVAVAGAGATTREGSDYVFTVNNSDLTSTGDKTCGVIIAHTSAALPVPPTYMALVRDEDTAAYHQGKIVKPSAAAILSRFSHLRFMDWHGGNHADPPIENPDNLIYADHRQVPLEVLAQVCRELDVGMYLNIHAKTPISKVTDYYRPVLETLVDDGYSVKVENSNEVWNYMFPQATYAQNEAWAAGYSTTAEHPATWWNGRKTAQIAIALRGSGVEVCVGVQTVQQPHLSGILFAGMDSVAGFQYSDVSTWIISHYWGGTINLNFSGELGDSGERWVDTHNLDALADDAQNYVGPTPGAAGASLEYCRLYMQQAQTISASKGWGWGTYEGSFDFGAIPYSRDPAKYKVVMRELQASDLHPLCYTSTLEQMQEYNCSFGTHFNFDQPAGDTGWYAVLGLPALDALVAWQDEVRENTGGYRYLSLTVTHWAENGAHIGPTNFAFGNLSEIRMFGDEAGTIPISMSGVAVTGDAYPGEEWQHTIDGNNATTWTSSLSPDVDTNGSTGVFDFGPNRTVRPGRIDMQTRLDNIGRSPYFFIWRASVDGLTWVTIHTSPGVGFGTWADNPVHTVIPD